MGKKDDGSAREKRIREICAAINKGAFGGDAHDAVTYLGSRESVAMDRWPSGCVQLDDALGGGWPKGRFIEVFGPESGGKTTLVLHAIAEHQKKYPGEDVGLIDVEYSFDEDYARAIGVDTKYLIVHQPQSGPQALNVTRQLIQQGLKLIVTDSVAALTTDAELEGDLGDQKMAEQARMMSSALRILTGEAGARKVTMLFTNQIREKIGVMFGDKTTTPAGKALKHYASVRVQIVRIGTVKEKVGDDDVVVSAKTKADVKKNKTAPPFRKAEFCISFGHGIDRVAEVLDTSVELGVVTKRGAQMSFDGEIIGAGRSAALELMRGLPDLVDRMAGAVTAAKASKAEEGDEPKLKRPPQMGKGPEPVVPEAGEGREETEEGATVEDA